MKIRSLTHPHVFLYFKIFLIGLHTKFFQSEADDNLMSWLIKTLQIVFLSGFEIQRIRSCFDINKIWFPCPDLLNHSTVPFIFHLLYQQDQVKWFTSLLWLCHPIITWGFENICLSHSLEVQFFWEQQFIEHTALKTVSKNHPKALNSISVAFQKLIWGGSTPPTYPSSPEENPLSTGGIGATGILHRHAGE